MCDFVCLDGWLWLCSSNNAICPFLNLKWWLVTYRLKKLQACSLIFLETITLKGCFSGMITCSYTYIFEYILLRVKTLSPKNARILTSQLEWWTLLIESYEIICSLFCFISYDALKNKYGYFSMLVLCHLTHCITIYDSYVWQLQLWSTWTRCRKSSLPEEWKVRLTRALWLGFHFIPQRFLKPEVVLFPALKNETFLTVTVCLLKKCEPVTWWSVMQAGCAKILTVVIFVTSLNVLTVSLSNNTVPAHTTFSGCDFSKLKVTVASNI